MRSHKQHDVQYDGQSNQTHRSFLCRKTKHACYLPVKYVPESRRNI